MDKIDSRENLGQWLNAHYLTGAGAEIGCSNGGFARTVLSKWRGKRYWMVDPWSTQDSKVYRERQEQPEVYDAWFRECSALSDEDPRIITMRKFSVKAAKSILEKELDWVFIDGNHSYDAVTEDLNAWWPKVKYGGLFGGHDCVNHDTDGWHCFVLDAVRDWVKNIEELEFHITPCSSWWIYK